MHVWWSSVLVSHWLHEQLALYYTGDITYITSSDFKYKVSNSTDITWLPR